MAESPSHRFGQIIGDLLEATLQPHLEKIATEHGLYLDHKHPRATRGGKRKVAWTDYKKNVHDLDFVLEEGGSESKVGRPRAFIETAWRRYTKHSRNKAQEIHGAIIPLAETYRDSHPFLGVVLAGVFTDGSLTQLRSNGFSILYYPYESVVTAFATVDIDATFDEDTPDAEVAKKVAAYDALGAAQRNQVAAELVRQHPRDLDTFLNALKTTLTRAVQTVYIVPLHGRRQELTSINDAIRYLERYDEATPATEFVRYEVVVRYTNGDEVRGEFRERTAAITFLQTFAPPPESS